MAKVERLNANAQTDTRRVVVRDELDAHAGDIVTGRFTGRILEIHLREREHTDGPDRDYHAIVVIDSLEFD